MRLVVLGLIFAAVILAGGTAYLLNSYLSAQKADNASVAVKMTTVKVLVADADMPVGTVVSGRNTRWVDWPESDVRDGFIVFKSDKNSLQAIENPKHVTRRAITTGEPILMARLYTSKNPGFLPGVLSPGMRAVAVGINAKTGAAGFIMPGDHVDVVLTHNMARRAAQYLQKGYKISNVVEFTTETVLQDIRILAIDQKTNEFKNAAKIAKTALLEVSPKQAEILNTAKAMGTLSLTLRSAENKPRAVPRNDFTTDVEVSPFLQTISKTAATRTKAAAARRIAARRAASRRAAARKSSSEKSTRQITIYRGSSDALGAQNTGTSGNTAP